MFTTRIAKRLSFAAVVGAAALTLGSGTAFAQSHDQRHEKADFKDHQRMERRDFGKNAVRDHQRAETRAFKNQERAERRGYYGGNAYPPYGTQHPSGNYPYGGYGHPGGYSSAGPYHSNSGHGNSAGWYGTGHRRRFGSRH